MALRKRIWDAGRRQRVLYHTMTLFYATPTGGPVLRGEASWRNINGLMISTRWGWAWFVFRRWHA